MDSVRFEELARRAQTVLAEYPEGDTGEMTVKEYELFKDAKLDFADSALALLEEIASAVTGGCMRLALHAGR
ncbi:hypothetical protein [Streptomyces phytophilus]|uniref:hypothetical protein n=1 Tax=Streptomyces phytophilus TaxID=722715 RepID=UPI0015F0D086|nr:hypothetical protein [Streptomyces phytophilus]